MCVRISKNMKYLISSGGFIDKSIKIFNLLSKKEEYVFKEAHGGKK